MHRKQTSIRIRHAVATVFALVASSTALADDNSMSRWTGDSYAYFNDLDYHPGTFNTARARPAEDSIANMPRKEPTTSGRPIMLADLLALRTRNSPFRDDTGA